MFQHLRLLAVVLTAMVAVEGQAAVSLWQEIEPQAGVAGSEIPTRVRGIASQTPQRDLSSRLYSADESVIRSLLVDAPHENSGDRSHVIELPLGNGEVGEFYVQESPMVEAGFAADFPEIKTYRVRGIDDPIARGRLSLTRLGFHGMLRTSRGRVFIDPETIKAGDNRFLMRQQRDPDALAASPRHCAVNEIDQSRRPQASPAQRSAARVPGRLLQYRLAVSATEEYRLVFGTVSDAQSAIVVAINRVNEVYERDLGIQFVLVANNQNLIEIGGNVTFSNNSPFALFAENQAWIDSEIGDGLYDVGHVFSTGGGGLALLGSACATGVKAQGVTGQNNPVGDPFYIDFVAHELGHQFNADHSFNGTTNACGGINRSGPTAYEPGSGSTIMAYAGICGVENLQANSNDTFHAGSIAQIDAFVAGAGSCGVQVATDPVNNADPTITIAATSYTIPIGTPFALDASAADADLLPTENLTYQWDQLDGGGAATDPVTFGTDLGTNPLFRSYSPQLDSRRDFPALGTQLQNLFDDAEVIPCNARALDFRLTVRDGSSGQATEDLRVTTTAAAGPFQITSLGTPQTLDVLANNLLTWDVANTGAGSAVNCPNVVIELLTFVDAARSQYSVHRMNGGPTLNDGNELLVFEDTTLSHPRARIRLRCEDNVFYDISNADLDIDGTTATLYDANDSNTFFNNNGTTGPIAPACTITGGGGGGGGGSGGGGGGGSSADLLLLATIGGLWWLTRRRRRSTYGSGLTV